jgi:hypothetical protein
MNRLAQIIFDDVVKINELYRMLQNSLDEITPEKAEEIRAEKGDVEKGGEDGE